ncbi:hypothetical protein Glove_297g23 [Diversispora epigaea]|uniref:Uncharacterized protein n=1 Tax=Diversispora epigaea TaxID=1348612 RepID=A0A397I4B7_9GLOM|nr:hypothetical protein Glove_297g23 [Diversispora epigaea]
MNNIPIPDSLRKRVHELRREFPQILGEAQVIIDNTGAYLVTENTVIEINQPVNNEITMQYDDMLTMYAVDIFTALEEQDRAIDLDLDELLRIATDMHGTNGQRMNAYKKLGDYLQDAQLGSTVTVLKRELHERSHQNGARIYQIATRIRSLFQVIGTPYARNFRNITPDWIYKLPKSEFERFLQLCETMGTQLMEDLLEIGVGSQELPFEGGNVSRIYQIATRIRSLFQVIGTPYARNFRNITPDWIYKLPKSEFERFLQLCETMGTQLMEDLLEIGVGSQELPFEGGNVCGEAAQQAFLVYSAVLDLEIKLGYVLGQGITERKLIIIKVKYHSWDDFSQVLAILIEVLGCLVVSDMIERSFDVVLEALV